MRRIISRRAHLKVRTMAALLLVATSLVLIRPPKTQAFVIIDLKSFFDPVDVAPGQIFRVRASNQFAGESIRTKVGLRSANDGSLILVLFDGNLMPGQGMVRDVNGDALPGVQRGIIAVLTFTLTSPGLQDAAGEMPASVELLDLATMRTTSGVWRHLVQGNRGM